ncbi:hypothetical protein AQUCO_03900028v1 [Aquilegia coerulea]|uniref:Uncharacterized protein n=1 Tax=Aquilegia coerulea TaxID=218851 RepID=A0A2G5CRM3_AQUCA|nr:hypothetical protein AQUCO_03900028v1 [Aquilegia coerulea]
MISLKTLKPQHYYKLLKHQNPLLITQTFFKLNEFVLKVESNSVLPTSFTQRRGFTSEEHDLMKRGMKKMKSLDVLFKEAVGLNEKIEGESGDSEEEEEDNELKKKLKKIEKEVRMMKGNVKEKGKKKNTLKKKKKETVLVEKEKSVAGLYTLFKSIPKKAHSLLAENDDCEKKQEGKEFSIKLRPMKELSPELISLVKLLVEEGYLNDANFLPRTKEFDLDCFSTLYSRGFVKARAERLGKDHPEITKCLSEIEIKRLALFGCPSVEKKTAFAAKRLRSYFDIQEDIVCRACKLNSSCKVKFHTVGKKYDTMDLADVMKILTLYSLELVPSELTIPDETKESINILLKQVVDHFQQSLIELKCLP